jgi:hypothetical protein
MSVKQNPHYTVPAEALAKWIEERSERWWFVDGDPLLTSTVDFPCPGDELAPAIRKIGKNLLLQDKDGSPTAKGQVVQDNRLDELSDTRNRQQQKTLLLSWSDSDIDWLLSEDEAMVAR